MPIVDPEPWFRQVRDLRLRQRRAQMATATTSQERRATRAEMRRTRRDYRRAILQRHLVRW